jgi:hypothetical protein
MLPNTFILCELLPLEGVLFFQDIYVISLSLCRPIHGLIFLFKWVQDDEPTGSVVQDTRLDKIFFAKQVRNFMVFSPSAPPQSRVLL